MKLKKLAILGIATIATLSLFAACGKKEGGGSGKTVGIAMPSKALERWEKDGNYMVEQLKKTVTKLIFNMRKMLYPHKSHKLKT